MDENFEEQQNNVEESPDNKFEEQKREMKEYEAIKDKLKSIEDKISNEDLSMDESLELYEEAVNLGMKASQTVENNVLANLAEDDSDEQDKTEE